MSLATFGAIISYALELEHAAFEFYSKMIEQNQREPFEELVSKTKKMKTRLERLRREGVSEMILEPIHDLEESDYLMPSRPPKDTEGLFVYALELEETRHRFYMEAMKKIPIRDVARQFERIAKERAEDQARLEQYLNDLA
jgi:rubrerythrin